MEYDVNTLVQHLKDANIDIEGMSFEDAYEEVFTVITDMFAANGTAVEGEVLHACQDATDKYLEDKGTVLTESVGDLPAGYSEDEAAEYFEKDIGTFEPDYDDFSPSEDEKARMAQYIAVHGAPDYNGHQWFKTLHGEDVDNFSEDDFDAADDLGIKVDYSYDTITLTFPYGFDDVYPSREPSSPYEGREEYLEESVVTKFFKKLEERDGLAIAANTNYTHYDAQEKIIRKYGIRPFSNLGHYDIDGEEFKVYVIGENYYGEDPTGKLWLLDCRNIKKEVPVEGSYYSDDYETEIEIVKEFQINSPAEDEKILEFFKAMKYLDSDEASNARRNARKAEKEAKQKELADAKRIIKVDITDAHYKVPEDFANDVDDEDWSAEDEEASFDITVSVGETKVFSGTAYPILVFYGSNVITSYTPARMYLRNGDPGYPEESTSRVTVTFEGLDGVTELRDADDNDISIEQEAKKVPEGKFRDMFLAYAMKVIDDAIDSKVAEAGDYEDEYYS